MEFREETIEKIIRNKSKLEKKLNIKLDIKDNSVKIKGEEVDIFVADKVFEAIDRNFSVDIALLLTNEDYVFEQIPIKSIAKKNLRTVRARIIGTRGKTLETLSEISECFITLNNNIVSIIGQAEKIKETMIAITNLIKGSKQANVFSYLKKHKKEADEDLGIR